MRVAVKQYCDIYDKDLCRNRSNKIDPHLYILNRNKYIATTWTWFISACMVYINLKQYHIIENEICMDRTPDSMITMNMGSHFTSSGGHGFIC